MVIQSYTITSVSHMELYLFEYNLKQEHVKFKTKLHQFCPESPYLRMDVTINTSPDMVKEVEELIFEIAKKSGARVE